MLTITVACEKGGVAKTVTACTIAHGLAIKGHRVLIADCDPQGQAASALGRNHESGVFNWLVSDLPPSDVVRSTGRENLYLIPGDRRTMTAQIVLNFEHRTLRAIQKKLPDLVKATIKTVVIDTAPSVGGLQEAALYAADLVIVPTATDYLSTEGVIKTFDTLKMLRDEHNWKGRVFGILPTFYDEVTRESKATLDDLKATFGEKLILSPIHRATILRECSAEGLTVWEKAPSSRAAKEYADLVWRLHDGTA